MGYPESGQIDTETGPSKNALESDTRPSKCDLEIGFKTNGIFYSALCISFQFIMTKV